MLPDKEANGDNVGKSLRSSVQKDGMLCVVIRLA